MIRKIYTNKEEFSEQNTALKTNLPYSENIDVLKEKINIKNKTIYNRLVCQPMEGCDGSTDGIPDVLTKRRYERMAKGASGIIWYEATAVLNEGRANPRQLFINDKNLDELKHSVEEIKETGLKENGFEPVIIMQATHSGRYSKPNGTPAPLIAYNNPIFEKNNPISSEHIVSDEYLDRVNEALVNGAYLAQKAGFDGADIKCCHRYLNSELLSAYEREGKYGGSLENRTRLLRESIKGAIEICDKNFIVTSRLNIYDGFPYPYGFGVNKENGIEMDLTEPVWLIKNLYNLGVELINITMGNPYFNPHVNRPFTKGPYTDEEHPLQGVARILNGTSVIKENIPDMKIVCSGITYLGTVAPNVVSAFIRQGKFDFAGFGRTAFAYPDYAKDILNKNSMDKNKCCLCCSKCTEIMRSGGTPGCVIRDNETYLPIYKKFLEV